MPSLHNPKGVDLYYERRGEEGPALLLLNGMSQSTANWMTQSRKLAQNFQVTVYDARGQGRTPVGDVPLTLDTHIDDLYVLLDGLGLDKVSLCGFSFGARIALGFAARHPDRVSSLILTSAGDGESALRRLIVRSWYEVLLKGGLEAMAWCAMPHILGEDFLAKHENQLAGMIRASRSRNSEEGLRALLEGYQDFPPPLDDAHRVKTKTLVISAAKDPLVSQESTSNLVNALQNAEHTLIEGCGHTIPIEAPLLWRTRVEKFF